MLMKLQRPENQKKILPESLIIAMLLEDFLIKWSLGNILYHIFPRALM